MRKRVAILGSTGSIGTQTLDVIAQHKDRFQVSVLSCEKRIDKLCAQIEVFGPELVVTATERDALELARKYPRMTFLHGMPGLVEAACSDHDILVNALMGMRGLVPTYRAALAGKNVAFANKETLVAGGRLIMAAVKAGGGAFLPVDSEHSAIFQCLLGNQDREAVLRLILTASGGPFRGRSLRELEEVTTEAALRHPKWTMGAKITVDSATMMNKGLEIIEAKWLFDLPETKIDVLVHPQSIVHSMVEYADGSVIAQMGRPDMRGPIRFALGYPDRIPSRDATVDFLGEAQTLTFEKPDEETFRCLKLARQAIREENSSYPVALNAANERLVQLFLEKKIKFLEIQNTIERILETHRPEYDLDIERILDIDQRTRDGVERSFRK